MTVSLKLRAGANDVAAVTTLTQVDSATSTAATITVPASVVEGDILVLVDMAISLFSSPSKVVPGDFTEVRSEVILASNIGVRLTTSVKLATSSDGGTSKTGQDGGFLDNKIMCVYRGDIPVTSITVGATNGQATGGNPSSQTVLSGAGTPPLVVIGAYGCNGTTDPRTMSPAKDGEANSGQCYQAWKIYNSSPANVSVDMDDEGNQNAIISTFIEAS